MKTCKECAHFGECGKSGGLDDFCQTDFQEIAYFDKDEILARLKKLMGKE